MNRTWLNVINEIIGSKNDNIAVEVGTSESGKTIGITVGDYKRYLKAFPHADSISRLVKNLTDIMRYDLHTIQEDNKTIYIINKDGDVNIGCDGDFLYKAEDIEPECIDYEFTGNVDLKKASASLQDIGFKVDNTEVELHLTTVSVRHLTMIELIINDELLVIPIKEYSEIDDIAGKLQGVIDVDDDVVDKIIKLLKLYILYM